MIRVAVTEPTQVAEARRAAVGIAQRLGFAETAAGRVAIVATELATNLIKHGGGGHLLAGPGEDSTSEAEVLLIAADKGPGMADVGRAMRDGMSTSGTPGNGLGAIRRQSHACEIFSRPGLGTVVGAWLRSSRLSPVTPRTWGAIGVAYPGEEVSGDAYGVRQDGDLTVVMVVDGLGHGPQAAEAATQAQRLFDKHWRQPPADLLDTLHAGMRATRGAAVAIARVEAGQRVVRYAGVGNIAGVLASAAGESKRMLSHNGTVGHVARKIQALDYPMPAGPTLLIMHSDGLGTSWSPDNYPGLVQAHPTLAAALLYRDFDRGRDDATVIVLQVGA